MKNDPMLLRFLAGTAFTAFAGGKQSLQLTYEGGEVCFALTYAGNVKYNGPLPPLTLSCKAEKGDRMEVLLMSHRIELYKNGVLMDEEWPCGHHLLAETTLPEGITALPYLLEKKEEPSVLGTFENAEGWQPGENVFAGDCMPYAHGDRYHLLYLKDRRRHHSKWGYGAHQWAHLSTEDFITWQIHPLAVEITEDWEGSICTGSWIEHEGVHYLYYTVRTCDGSPAPIRRSVSKDGYHFEKDGDFSFTLDEKVYYAASARDPKVVRAADGSYHIFLTTSLQESGRGCLAHFVSPDLEHWSEKKPIYIAPDENQPECPDYFVWNGVYYLIFSHHGKGEYLYSDRPFDGWKKPEDGHIDCKSVPKMAFWGDRVIFAGFDGGGKYAGTLTFTEAFQNLDGTLRFVHMKR